MLHYKNNQVIIRISEVPAGIRVEYNTLYLSTVVKTYEEAKLLYNEAYRHYNSNSRFGGEGPKLTLWGK